MKIAGLSPATQRCGEWHFWRDKFGRKVGGAPIKKQRDKATVARHHDLGTGVSLAQSKPKIFSLEVQAEPRLFLLSLSSGPPFGGAFFFRFCGHAFLVMPVCYPQKVASLPRVSPETGGQE